MVPRGEVGLDLLVVDDPARLGVDEEHPARLEPALTRRSVRAASEHADLGGQHDSRRRAPSSGRAKAVAVEDGTEQRSPSVKATAAGPSQGSMSSRDSGRSRGAPVHRRMVLPGLGDHHQHRVRQRAPAEMQELEDLVEVAESLAPGLITGKMRSGPPKQTARAGAPPGPASSCGCPDRVDLAVMGEDRYGWASGHSGRCWSKRGWKREARSPCAGRRDRDRSRRSWLPASMPL